MTDTFKIEVYTPAGKALQGSSDDVKLPSSGGEIGVLSNHRKYVGAAGTGVMEFKCHDSGDVKRAVISGGFIGFDGRILKILADFVDLPETVDTETYALDREELKAVATSGNVDSPEAELARQKLARIEAIEKLISH